MIVTVFSVHVCYTSIHRFDAKVLPALENGAPHEASRASSTDTSGSSGSSSSSTTSSDTEEEGAQAGVPNPPLGLKPQLTTSDEEEYIPNPALTVGPASDEEPGDVPVPQDEDENVGRPAKIQRCSLCYDFDALLEDHLRVCEALEEAEKKIAELRAILASRPWDDGLERHWSATEKKFVQRFEGQFCKHMTDLCVMCQVCR